jgi:hypothetical protein
MLIRIGGKQDVFNDLTTVMALIPSNYSKSDGFPDYERIEAVSGRADRPDAGFWGSKVVDDYDYSLLQFSYAQSTIKGDMGKAPVLRPGVEGDSGGEGNLELLTMTETCPKSSLSLNTQSAGRRRHCPPHNDGWNLPSPLIPLPKYRLRFLTIRRGSISRTLSLSNFSSSELASRQTDTVITNASSLIPLIFCSTSCLSATLLLRTNSSHRLSQYVC